MFFEYRNIGISSEGVCPYVMKHGCTKYRPPCVFIHAVVRTDHFSYHLRLMTKLLFEKVAERTKIL